MLILNIKNALIIKYALSTIIFRIIRFLYIVSQEGGAGGIHESAFL